MVPQSVSSNLQRIAAKLAASDKFEEAKKIVDNYIKKTLRELGSLALDSDDSKAVKEHVKKQWGIK